jgi:hypothetical protein
VSVVLVFGGAFGRSGRSAVSYVISGPQKNSIEPSMDMVIYLRVQAGPWDSNVSYAPTELWLSVYTCHVRPSLWGRTPGRCLTQIDPSCAPQRHLTKEQSRCRLSCIILIAWITLPPISSCVGGSQQMCNTRSAQQYHNAQACGRP